MLKSISNEIVQLQTPAFYEFVRRSGLGTS